jgi:MoxR-like ATPase
MTALNTLAQELKGRFIARDEEIEMALLSIITGSNMLLVGPPGAAKSAVVGDLLARVEGKKGFFPLTKGSKPDEVLGPPDLKAIDKGRSFYHTLGEVVAVSLAACVP